MGSRKRSSNSDIEYLVVEDQRAEESRHGRRHGTEDQTRQLSADVVQLERHVDVHQGGCLEEGAWLRLVVLGGRWAVEHKKRV